MVFDLCKAFGAKNVVQPPPASTPEASSGSSDADEVALLFDEDDACIPYFYHVSPTSFTCGVMERLKYHIQSFSDPDRIECTSTLDIGSMISAGTNIPLVDSICKKCLARRPDLSTKLGLAITA